ncbi:MAG: sulfotransferase [Candidatus Abyssobacteria bacterium SURF_17]|uniref:Sulfotransferase n=1 Tax=Candidatus Abyssobacteria bacterium SURF_17 TaxID=2093361 RepID=A0A419EWD0_9BACT|nr:MAG: sulfotransferase [Candidatus Abyssubacteria bacterium SURF_17]
MGTRAPLIFIVGNPRSGTTMMAKMLGKHPLVYAVPRELHFFEKLWAPEDRERMLTVEQAVDLTARLLSNANNTVFSQGKHERFEEEARTIVGEVNEENHYPAMIYEAFLKHAARKSGRPIVCEKTPAYVYYIPEILSLFPEAKVVNMVRDPRDVLLSQKHRWKRRYLGNRELPLGSTIRAWFNYSPVWTSRLWNAATTTASRFIDGKRVHSVKFEDVLENPEAELQKVCEFLRIPYAESMLSVPMAGSSLVRDRPEETGVDKERTANWRGGGLNSAEIFICQMITTKNMARFGYERGKVFPNPILLLFYLFVSPTKLLVSFFLQARYIKNVGEAVKRRLVRTSDALP